MAPASRLDHDRVHHRRYQDAIRRDAPLAVRADAADALAVAAHRQRDREAWEVVQVLEWRLQRRGHCRPSEPGDVLVLDRLRRAAEDELPAVSLPPDLDPDAFCDRLAADVLAAARVTPDPIERLCAATLEDWPYLVRGMMADSIDFTRLIALASVRLPHRHARLLYHNLYDEAGRGSWPDNHFKLFADFAHAFDVPVPGFDRGDDDDRDLLDWVAPDVIAEVNAHRRALLHEEPGWALGSMFVVEELVPGDLAPVLASLRARGLPASALAFLEVHLEADVGHAADWRAVARDYAITAADQHTLYVAALDAARWYARGWTALVAGLQTWRDTGAPPRLPARELDAPLDASAALDAST